MLKLSFSDLQTIILLSENLSLVITCLWEKVIFSPNSTPTMLKYLSLAIAEAIVLAPSFFLLYLSETNSAYTKLFNISHTPIHDMSHMLSIVILFVMIILANKYLKQYHDRSNENKNPETVK